MYIVRTIAFDMRPCTVYMKVCTRIYQVVRIPDVCSSLHIMMVTSSVSFLQALVSICMYMYVNVCIMYVYCSIFMHMYMYVYVCICMYNSKVGLKTSKYEKQYMRNGLRTASRPAGPKGRAGLSERLLDHNERVTKDRSGGGTLRSLLS